MKLDILLTRHLRDTRERSPQIALHIDSQRLDRRNVEYAASLRRQAAAAKTSAGRCTRGKQ